MSCLTLYVVNACVSTCVYDCRSSVCVRAHMRVHVCERWGGGGGGVHVRVCGSGKGGDIESDNALSN